MVLWFIFGLWRHCTCYYISTLESSLVSWWILTLDNTLSLSFECRFLFCTIFSYSVLHLYSQSPEVSSPIFNDRVLDLWHPHCRIWVQFSSLAHIRLQCYYWTSLILCFLFKCSLKTSKQFILRHINWSTEIIQKPLANLKTNLHPSILSTSVPTASVLILRVLILGWLEIVE